MRELDDYRVDTKTKTGRLVFRCAAMAQRAAKALGAVLDAKAAAYHVTRSFQARPRPWQHDGRGGTAVPSYASYGTDVSAKADASATVGAAGVAGRRNPGATAKADKDKAPSLALELRKASSPSFASGPSTHKTKQNPSESRSVLAPAPSHS